MPLGWGGSTGKGGRGLTRLALKWVAWKDRLKMAAEASLVLLTSSGSAGFHKWPRSQDSNGEPGKKSQ